MRVASSITFALLVCLGMTAGTAAAMAQMVAQNTPPQTAPRDDGYERRLAPTGQTLPHPGASQIGDESAQEKGAQKRSDRDTHSICSNCE